MSNIPASAYVIGMLLVAFVTGVFTLVNLIISKEQKISDMRQEWIENLRKDISGFMGEIETLSRLAEAYMDALEITRFDAKQLAAFRTSYIKNYMRLNELGQRILLRLNKQEHESLIIRVEWIMDTFYGSCEKIMDRINPVAKEITLNSQDIIKSVWEDVKRGEKVYRYTRRIIISILGALLAFAATMGLLKLGGYVCGHLTTG